MAKSNPGTGKLLAAMRKLIAEVNDQEICRRLEILQNSEKEDLSASIVKKLLEAPEDFDPRIVQEPYTQYVKHYLYMVKRAQRERARGEGQDRRSKRGGARKSSGANSASGSLMRSARGKSSASGADAAESSPPEPSSGDA